MRKKMNRLRMVFCEKQNVNKNVLMYARRESIAILINKSVI